MKASGVVNDSISIAKEINGHYDQELTTLIDYDEMTIGLANEIRKQESIQSTTTVTANNGSSSEFKKEELEAWRITRKKALVKLDEELHAALSRKRSPSNFETAIIKPKIIIMDDNFHLRSMRRDVYKVCQNFIVNNNHHNNEHSRSSSTCVSSNSFSIGLVLIHVDIPYEQCIQNNERRKDTLH